MPTVVIFLHPQHRLLLLLLLAVCLPMQSLPLLIATHMLLLLLSYRKAQLGAWWQSFLRLKWLLISITLLYGWFTPGLPIYEVTGVNMPSGNGLLLAAHRALLLSALVAAVMWLVKPLQADVLAAAITALLLPFKLLGLPVQLFARRLALTLAKVSEFQKVLAAADGDSWLGRLGGLIVTIEAADDEAGVNAGPPLALSKPNAQQSLAFLSLLALGLLALYLGRV